MGKDIRKFYKHGQSQISTLSLKAPVSSSSNPQTSSAIELTTTYVPPITDKNQQKSILYSQNTIQNDSTITNNEGIQSCDIEENIIIAFQPFQHLIIIQKILLTYPHVH